MKKYCFYEKEHLHTLDGRPLTGTSTIGKVLNKELVYWACGLTLKELGWVNPKIKVNGVYKTVDHDERVKAMVSMFTKIRFMELNDWIALLDKAYKAHKTESDKAKVRGVEMHKQAEHFVKAEMGKQAHLLAYSTKIQPFIDWSRVNVKRFIASEAHCYDETLFVGGIMDYVAELNEIKLDTGVIPDGTIIVGDFKSSKDSYLNQFTQAGGYALQINNNGLFSANGEHNLKLDKPIGALGIIPFGAENLNINQHIRCNVNDFIEGFRCTHYLYKLLGFTE